MTAKRQPIVVKVGNASAKIYRLRAKTSGYEYFQVADFTSGKRKLISFADEESARQKAKEIAVKLASNQLDVLAMTGKDRSAYLRALDLLKPTGIPLELGVAQFADVVKKLGGRSLAVAVDFYLKCNPIDRPRKTCEEVFKELLDTKSADGVSEIYLKDLKVRIGKFVVAFQMQISDVTTNAVDAWLRSLECGARARNNYRRAVISLFSFAEARDYLTKDHVNFDKVAKATEKETTGLNPE